MEAVLATARKIGEYSVAGLAALWHHLRYYLLSCKTEVQKQDKGTKGTVENIYNHGSSTIRPRICALTSNSRDFDTSGRRKPILDNVMEALADPNAHLIGVYGSDDETKNTLLERVRRRLRRDQLFDAVLSITITKNPNMKKIQDEIAGQLGFNFHEKSKHKRASELRDKIKKKQEILIILCDLCKGLDLDKVGIPFAADHTGCKILLFSTREEVLSNQMHAQKMFMV